MFSCLPHNGRFARTSKLKHCYTTFIMGFTEWKAFWGIVMGSVSDRGNKSFSFLQNFLGPYWVDACM